MKTIALGDIHGRSIWKDIISKGDFDKVIFCGDYFDTHDDISAVIQKHNFKEILDFKIANIDKVVLLIGNHDFHYMKGIKESYSGYQYTHAIDFQILINDAVKNDLMQLCHIEGNILFSHAGFTKTWCEEKLGCSTPNPDVLESIVNELFKYQPRTFGFNMGLIWTQLFKYSVMMKKL